jgi:hypothetical protein
MRELMDSYRSEPNRTLFENSELIFIMRKRLDPFFERVSVTGDFNKVDTNIDAYAPHKLDNRPKIPLSRDYHNLRRGFLCQRFDKTAGFFYDSL